MTCGSCAARVQRMLNKTDGVVDAEVNFATGRAQVTLDRPVPAANLQARVEKLDEDTQPYMILGACNPQLAHRALQIEPDIGLLLPCNIVGRADGPGTLVQALDPKVMVTVPGRAELQPIAQEASRRIQAALDTPQGR